jgi:hypothetical protein
MLQYSPEQQRGVRRGAQEPISDGQILFTACQLYVDDDVPPTGWQLCTGVTDAASKARAAYLRAVVNCIVLLEMPCEDSQIYSILSASQH